MVAKDHRLFKQDHENLIICSARDNAKKFNESFQRISSKNNIETNPSGLKTQSTMLHSIRKALVGRRTNNLKIPKRRKVFNCIFSPADLLKTHGRLSFINLEGFDQYVTKMITCFFDNKNGDSNKIKETKPKLSFWKHIYANLYSNVSKRESDDYVWKDQSTRSILMQSHPTNQTYLHMSSRKGHRGIRPSCSEGGTMYVLPKGTGKYCVVKHINLTIT